jgi:hypothetical protein
MINHRVQDFQDPLTSTLVLMATAPLQFILCETGMLLFKTNLLPVMPYSLLTVDERTQLHTMLNELTTNHLHETTESSGQYTLTVLHFTQNPSSSPTVHHMNRTHLLLGFIDIMKRQPQFAPHDSTNQIDFTASQMDARRVPPPYDRSSNDNNNNNDMSDTNNTNNMNSGSSSSKTDSTTATTTTPNNNNSGGGITPTTTTITTENDYIVGRTLSSIVLQRFWSRVSTPSEIINCVMQHLTRHAPSP